MLRYCSLSKCKLYLKGLKNRSLRFVNLDVDGNIGGVKTATSKDISKFINEISRMTSNIRSTHISTTQSGSQEIKSEPKKVAPRVNANKEIQKFCSLIRKRISNQRKIIFSTGGIAAVTSNQNVENIPEPPPVPDLVPDMAEEILNQVNALGEPTFASLGLGGSSPVGIAQYCFEYLHCTLGVEWWAAIAIGTIVIRLCLFPLVIVAQRNAAKMNNYLPQMQALQLRVSEARQTGNQIDAARYSQELMLFMKEKNLNPLKNMLVPLAQMPIFVSFFMGLRGMSNVPVESLRTGGLWWFTDLTLPDQYFLLPIITSATLYLTIELGTDSAKLSSQNMQVMKYVLRGLPLVVLPFTVNFPGAILCYWVSSNFISLAQVGFLRIPRVRDYFKIEPMQKFDPSTLPVKPKGFVAGLKDSWTNIKITKELEERRRLDELQFQRAGKGPIIKTYKYDPTKQTDPTRSPAISAKKR